jgi:hypothetical protein
MGTPRRLIAKILAKSLGVRRGSVDDRLKRGLNTNLSQLIKELFTGKIHYNSEIGERGVTLLGNRYRIGIAKNRIGKMLYL